MNDETIEAVVGGMRLRVPIIVDAETTQSIVDRVNERLKQIQSQSTRIDTYAFAVLAAVSFAGEAEELTRQREIEHKQADKERDQETRELLSALGDINKGLRNVLRKIREPEK